MFLEILIEFIENDRWHHDKNINKFSRILLVHKTLQSELISDIGKFCRIGQFFYHALGTNFPVMLFIRVC